MTPRATCAKYSCMSSTHIRSFAERLNRAGCTGPHIGALTIVRQHLFEPAWKALSSLDLREAQEYINTASVERKSALNPTTGVRPSRAIGCESIHRLQRVGQRPSPSVLRPVSSVRQQRRDRRPWLSSWPRAIIVCDRGRVRPERELDAAVQ